MAVTCGIFHYLAPGPPCCQSLCIVLTFFFHYCLRTHSFSLCGIFLNCKLLSSYCSCICCQWLIFSPWPVVPPALAPTLWSSYHSGPTSTAWMHSASTYGWARCVGRCCDMSMHMCGLKKYMALILISYIFLAFLAFSFSMVTCMFKH